MTIAPATRAATLLGIFAKHWEPGKVKTRLAKTIGESRAATLHALFVSTLVERLGQVGERRVIAFWPPQSQAPFAALARSRFEIWPQSSGDLGQRMQAFFTQGLMAAQRVVLIGSDSPDLPLELIDEAFRALQSHEVVLGPSADGGYYLIGLARQVPPIFDDISWSTPEVWPQTTSRLKAAGIAWHELPTWYDVDDDAGLHALLPRLNVAAAGDRQLARLNHAVRCLLGQPGKRPPPPATTP